MTDIDQGNKEPEHRWAAAGGEWVSSRCRVPSSPRSHRSSRFLQETPPYPAHVPRVWASQQSLGQRVNAKAPAPGTAALCIPGGREQLSHR